MIYYVKEFSADNPKYSENFHKYLKYKAKEGVVPNWLKVWRVRKKERGPYTLWIGTVDFDSKDGYWVGGLPINKVLIGEKGGLANHLKVKPTEVKDFWKKYKEIGVCAIDSAHHFYYDRWEVKGNKRICKYCGKKQILKKKKVVRIKEEWLDV